ncbi:hypothetical protein As57867_003231, partial [Aphanomyces stellatus]
MFSRGPKTQVTLDFQVQATQGKTTAWVWRQFDITGQKFEVRDADGRKEHSIATKHITIEQLCGHHYQLLKKGTPYLLFSAPSRTLLAKFQTFLRLAMDSSKWTLPASTDWANLMNVATIIVETEQAKPTPALHLSNVTVAQVEMALANMKTMFNTVMTPVSLKEELYEALLNMEAAYVLDPTTKNFAHTTESLQQYNPPKKGPSKLPLKVILSICPHPDCLAKLNITQMYAVHMDNKRIRCRQCNKSIGYETYQLATFLNFKPTFVQDLPPMPFDGAIATFIGAVDTQLRHQAGNSKHR